ncbi:MAG: Ig-like domain-containing protein [Gemmatimonadaceae bacterium]
MRRVAALIARLSGPVVFGAAVACASMQAPPGGPEDAKPPELVAVAPESGAVNFRGRAVEFRFDEVIDDRRTGAQALGALVLISPREGQPRVSWRRKALAVRPRAGWRPNTSYAVTLLPGVADLRGNATTEARTLVLSTGRAIAQLALRGRVFDWMAERPAPRAWVEAISRPDSVVYVTVADSGGGFILGPVPPGTYTVRAFIDQNNNRALDRAEAWDSVTAQPPRPGVVTALELRAAQRDTVPPRISGLSPTDSVTLAVEFDRPLDPAQTITPTLFAVARADSTPVAVRQAMWRRVFEREEEIRRARQDSARIDTARVRARPDTARGRARPDTARADTARAAPARPRVLRAGLEGEPKPAVPAPPIHVILRLAAPLAPGASYRVTSTGVRNLLGRAGTTTRVIQIPRPAAADTTRRPRP